MDIILSVVAIIISTITLYMAHIRGSNIILATNNSKYYTKGFGGDEHNRKYEYRVIVANIGIRSGIFFDINIRNVNCEYKNIPKENIFLLLPKSLSPGETMEITYQVIIPNEKLSANMKMNACKSIVSIEATRGIFERKIYTKNVVFMIPAIINNK
jgi:hypothetical protein